MTLPKHVAVSVTELDRWSITDFDGECLHADAWRGVSAYLMSQEADIERLQAGLATHVDRVCELQSRLAAANALLRELLGAKWCTPEYDDACSRVAVHLQGASDEV